ncbi:MAG: hypothetical protein QF473_03475 [Planctomycetota bacterium]|nr:hypothetical protein [Planctomycetota bacterium]
MPRLTAYSMIARHGNLMANFPAWQPTHILKSVLNWTVMRERGLTLAALRDLPTWKGV